MFEYSWTICDKWTVDSGKSSWVKVTGQIEEGTPCQIAQQKVPWQTFLWHIEITFLSYVKSRPKKKAKGVKIFLLLFSFTKMEGENQ